MIIIHHHIFKNRYIGVDAFCFALQVYPYSCFSLITHAAMPDFARVYSFLGSIFDPDTSGHLQRLKAMDPIDVETVYTFFFKIKFMELFSSFDSHMIMSPIFHLICYHFNDLQFSMPQIYFYLLQSIICNEDSW